tara:strand:- start:1335 stop:2390 length:1056 start_codon:yes stop_codon:yes gene_type:complete
MYEYDADTLLYRILSKKLLLNYNNIDYCLLTPDVELKYLAEIEYNKIVNDEKFGNWLREDNIDWALYSSDLWTRDTQETIEKLEKKLENLKVELYLGRSMKDKTKKTRKLINSTRRQMNKLISNKEEIQVNTLESYANTIKNQFIIRKTLYKDSKLIFDNNQDGNFLLFNEVVSEINKHALGMSDFRKLARESAWKNYWNCDKTRVFQGCVQEWSDEQRTLANISRMYDSVCDHPEPPEDSVIEDDDMLDGWMTHQRRKNKKEKSKNLYDAQNPRLQKAQEVFLVANEDQSIEDIKSMNTPISKQIITERNKFLKTQKGEVKHGALPDVVRDVNNRLNTKIKESKPKRNNR